MREHSLWKSNGSYLQQTLDCVWDIKQLPELRGFTKKKKFKKFEISMEVVVGSRSHSEFFFLKIVPK